MFLDAAMHGGCHVVNRIVIELPDADTLPKVVFYVVDLSSLYRISGSHAHRFHAQAALLLL